MNPDFFRQFGFLIECLSPWKSDVLDDLSPLKFPEGGKDEGGSGGERGSEQAKKAAKAKGRRARVGGKGRQRKERDEAWRA